MIGGVDWIDYLTVHAAILGRGGADATAIQRLHEACASVDAATSERILGAYHDIDRVRVVEALHCLRTSPLRFALFADASQMARGAGNEGLDCDPALASLATALDISDAQRDAVMAFIAASMQPPDPSWGGLGPQMDELRDAMQRARAVGIPTDVVAMHNLALGSFLGVVRLMHDLKLG